MWHILSSSLTLVYFLIAAADGIVEDRFCTVGLIGGQAKQRKTSYPCQVTYEQARPPAPRGSSPTKKFCERCSKKITLNKRRSTQRKVTFFRQEHQFPFVILHKYLRETWKLLFQMVTINKNVNRCRVNLFLLAHFESYCPQQQL